ncbi:MAG TPA: hypothetical protein VHB50_18565 [Bryobacteraceae bacterium]|nr:hypothetical protein [Bryobacteraceae bacterium]
MNRSTVMDDAGILASNVLSVPRCSQYTTVNVLFEFRIEMTEETHFRETGSAMQKDQEWISDVFGANHHPLIEATQGEIRDLCDAAGKDFASGPAKRRRSSRVLHGVA